MSITLHEGEIYGLIGPSGSGKTTLVKILLGLEKPDGGSVELLGKKPSLAAFHSLGYMAQSDALYNELSAWQNLDFFASVQGLKRGKRKQRIMEVAKLVDLQNDLKKNVSQFSGGMRRRLSLASALVHEPKLYLLDEPTVGLDPLIRKEIWALFQKLKKEGATIIVTTHVMDEVVHCDRIGLLNHGKILASGTPDELMEKYHVATLEDIFLIKEEA